MTHYDVLQVGPDAPQEEIRRAYLVQARRHHPDRNRGAGERAAADAEQRMRLVNEAWAVLGDPAKRRIYDQKIAAAARPDGPQDARAADTVRPPQPFRPYRPDTPDDPDEDDSWRFEPDRGDPATVPPRVLLAAPPAVFALGLTMLILSVPTGIRWFSAVGIICLLASALLFVGAPVVALFRSQISEERARRQGR